ISTECKEGTDNIIRVFSTQGVNNLPVTISNVVMATYDANDHPSCNSTGGDFTFPGSATLNQGTLVVSTRFDARFIIGKLSLRKNDSSVGWVCVDGVAQNNLVRPDFCTFDFCDYYGGVINAQSI
ncbi:hypothetical protein PFISCL1PPCAC_4008, partial [Pristionchus fissidentatus]